MIKLYAVNVKERLDSAIFAKLMRLLPEEKQARITRFYHFVDSQRTLVADVIVRTRIMEEWGISNQQIRFDTNTYGKPHVEQLDTTFHFNVSHSGDWVVCATDDQPIGIDIEEIKPIDLKIAKRFFSPAEHKNLLEQPEDQQLSRFFDFWSLKESYIKAVGMGLSIPLDSFTMQITDTGVAIETNNPYGAFWFKPYTIDPAYKLAVCAGHPNFPAYVQVQSLHELSEKAFSLVE